MHIYTYYIPSLIKTFKTTHKSNLAVNMLIKNRCFLMYVCMYTKKLMGKHMGCPYF